MTGTVEFFDGETSLGTAALVSGSARLTMAALTAGGHAISARYSGNGSVPPSMSGALAQTVQVSGDKSRAPATALSVSPSPSPLGGEVTSQQR